MKYYLKKHWTATALVGLLQAATLGIQAVINCLLIGLMDAAIRLDFEDVQRWVLIFIGGWGVELALTVLSQSAQAWAVRRYNNSVRQDLYTQLLAKSHEDYHSQSSGEYLSWLTNDIKQLETLAWRPLFDCVGRVAQVAASAVALVSLHWSLAVFAFASALVMFFVPGLFSGRMSRLGQNCTDQQALAVARLKDLLAGLDVLCCMGRQGRFLTQGAQVSDELEAPAYRLNVGKARTEGIIGMVNVTLQVSSMLLSVYLSLKGYTNPAIIVGATNLVAGVTNGLANLTNQRLSLNASKPYFAKITARAEAAAPAAPALPPLREGITVENVSFHYDEKKPILQNLNAEFRRGGKYALTGPSGCGKSTLLKILLGWLPGYEGAVRFDGTDMRACTPEQLQQQMSYIEQDVFLFNTTIRENITLGESFTDEQMNKALRDSALAGDLAAMPLGLDTPVGEEGSALSGGQKQRVAIARALIHDRSILLVDEGTSALDQKNADIVEKSLLANPDLTLILISHHLTEERKAQFDKVYALTPAAVA